MSGTVEGVDRELFIFLLGFDAVKDEASFHRIRAGEFDGWEKMQRIAQFRVAASRTTPPARSYADGVEDAAKVAEDLANAAARLQATLELHGVDAPIKNAQRETATTLAAAIRLLSQGGKA